MFTTTLEPLLPPWGNFTNCPSGPCAKYEHSVMSVNGWFTTAAPLPLGDFFTYVDLNTLVTSFYFNDGVNAYSSSDPGVWFSMSAVTDIVGNITSISSRPPHLFFYRWQTGGAVFPHQAGDRYSYLAFSDYDPIGFDSARPVVFAGNNVVCTAVVANKCADTVPKGSAELFVSGASVAWGLAYGGSTPFPKVAVMPPMLTRIVMRKSHGAAGTFDLPLNTWPGDPTTEARASDSGGSHVVVFTFDKPVASATPLVTSNAFVGAPSFSGNEIAVPVAPVSDGAYVSAAVRDVASLDGGINGFGSVRIGFLAGDATASRTVTLSDMLAANASLTQPVTTATYLRDVNRDGRLSLSICCSSTGD
jgi:hypothetical protein